jgi:hypothetical protein
MIGCLMSLIVALALFILIMAGFTFHVLWVVAATIAILVILKTKFF